MALTVITEPNDVMMVGNEIPLKLETDNRYSTAGTKAQLIFTFTGIDTTAGNTFVIAYGDVDLQIWLAASPDESGTQIRAASGGMPIDTWMAAFAEDLFRNYFIRRDWDMAVDNDANTITLTAKESGTDYTVTISFENLSNVALTDVDGVDPVARENFEIMCLTELYDGSEWIKLAEDRLQPDSSEQVTFCLQDLIVPELTAEYTWPEEPETYHALRSNHIKTYRLSHAEVYEDIVRRLSSASSYRAMLGAFDYKMIAALNGADYSVTDFITTYKSFLTWQPTTKKINQTQPEKLYFLVYNDIISMELHIKVYFTDGTDSGDQELETIAGVNQYEVYELMIGYSQIDFTKISAKIVDYYEIWLEDGTGTVQSEVRTYQVDTKTYRNERIFLFRNSFGGFDTFRATGRKTQVNEYERLILDKNDEGFSLQEQYQILERSVFTCSTGWITLAQRNWLRELLLSKEAYEIINGYKFPILITDEKREFRDDENYLYSLEINYRYAFKDPAFAGDYTQQPLLAENLNILLSEDGEPLYA